MVIIFITTAVLTGFVLGYFLTTPALTVVSIIAVIVAFVMRPKAEQEIGSIVGVIVLLMFIIGTVTSWTTHFYVTDSFMMIPDVPNISGYIFRK